MFSLFRSDSSTRIHLFSPFNLVSSVLDFYAPGVSMHHDVPISNNLNIRTITEAAYLPLHPLNLSPHSDRRSFSRAIAVSRNLFYPFKIQIREECFCH